jgi:hypothetical protein
MDKENKRMEIELRSEEFQEIVEQSPRWMIRSGISLVLGLVILLLAGSYFFKYPDVIDGNIILYAENSSEKVNLNSSPEQQIIAELQAKITGKINLSIKEARKVAVGQKVNIRLEDYPSMEYGYLQAKVKSISQIPGSGSYSVEVEVPQDLLTSFKIPIKFNQGMKGSAEIITADLRLIQRFVNPVKSLLKHRNTTRE